MANDAINLDVAQRLYGKESFDYERLPTLVLCCNVNTIRPLNLSHTWGVGRRGLFRV